MAAVDASPFQDFPLDDVELSSGAKAGQPKGKKVVLYVALGVAVAAGLGALIWYLVSKAKKKKVKKAAQAAAAEVQRRRQQHQQQQAHRRHMMAKHQQQQKQQQQQQARKAPTGPQAFDGQRNGKWAAVPSNNQAPNMAADARQAMANRYVQEKKQPYGVAYKSGDYHDLKPDAYDSYSSLHAAGKEVQDLDEAKVVDLCEKRGQSAVVAFVSQGCGHCKNMLPAYQQAAKMARLPFITAHYSKLQRGPDSLMKRHNIRGFPTVLRFEKGQVVAEYNGDRSAQSLTQFGS